MKTLGHFINVHVGKKAVVMGLGTSTSEIIKKDLSNVITIGVNDIGIVYTPKYLLTLDMSQRFQPQRSNAIKNTGAEYLFTQETSWTQVPELKDRIVIIKLGNRMLTNIDNSDILDYSSNSPYVGVLLAYRMGCHEIGIIGVDFTDNHVHLQDGKHELVRAGRLQEINNDYARLYAALKSRKCNLYNLSATSMLESIPKMAIDKFMENDEIHDI